MRVIAGSARRLLLKTVDGMDTRPTTDRIKETLFNMLQPQIPGCQFLDLFSGSGAIGGDDREQSPGRNLYPGKPGNHQTGGTGRGHGM